MIVKAHLLRLALPTLLIAAAFIASPVESQESCICEEGKSQSPIDIVGATPGQLPRLDFHYRQPAEVDVVASTEKETLSAAFVNPRPVLTIGSEVYVLQELHFHSPSEHKIRGAGAAMELHLVHRNQVGELAVVGVLMTAVPGRPNRMIDRLWENAGSEPTRLRIRTDALLPADHHYFRYAGSLTTGACAEGVRWHVLRSPLVISPEQAAAYPFPNTAREVQPLNGRPVLSVR